MALKIIVQRIQQITKTFIQFRAFHIIRNLNHEADVEAKARTSLKSRKIEFSNNGIGHHHIPLEIIQQVN